MCVNARCDTTYLNEEKGVRYGYHHNGSRPREGRTKAQATKALAAMGLSVSDAVRVFLTRVAAEKQLPFALKVPNTETRAAMEEARAISRARFATADKLINELEKGSQP